MSKSRFGADDHSKMSVHVEIPMTYLHLNAGSGKPLLVFFHGYSDTAAAFVRRALPEIDSRFEILAPNGLFPVPVKIESGWKRTFAWYFSDYSRNEVVMPPAVSAQAIQSLVENLGLESRPKILLGFSQGGFFLPFILPRLHNVQKMFAIGAAYRISDYPSDLTISLDALHGDKDDVILPDRARESFEELKRINPEGKFYEFKGLGHTMNDESRSVLKSKILEVFS